MINFSDIFDSKADYEENLQIFEENLPAHLTNPNGSLYFVEIFKSIENAENPTLQKSKSSLLGRLKLIEAQLNSAILPKTHEKQSEEVQRKEHLLSDFSPEELQFIQNSSPGIKVPLMGQPMSLKKMAEEEYKRSESLVKQGLLLFDQDYTLRTIRGDGHCAFRAIGAHLASHLITHPEDSPKIVARAALYSTNASRQLEKIFATLLSEDKADPSLNSLALRTQSLSPVQDSIDHRVEAFMNREEASDDLVKILRQLAVDTEMKMCKEFPDHFGEILMLESNSNPKHY